MPLPQCSTQSLRDEAQGLVRERIKNNTPPVCFFDPPTTREVFSTLVTAEVRKLVEGGLAPVELIVTTAFRTIEVVETTRRLNDTIQEKAERIGLERDVGTQDIADFLNECWIKTKNVPQTFRLEKSLCPNNPSKGFDAYLDCSIRRHADSYVTNRRIAATREVSNSELVAEMGYPCANLSAYDAHDAIEHLRDVLKRENNHEGLSILNLHICGLKLSEIARKLGMNAGAVRYRLVRMRRHLS